MNLVHAHGAGAVEADPRGALTVLADWDEVTSSRAVFLDGAEGAPPHLHTRASELFFVLGGELQMLVGEEVLVLKTGDIMMVPPGTPHAFGAIKGCDTDLLCVFTPGVERSEYYELLDRVQRGEAAPEEITVSSERFDNHYVESEVWRRARV